MKNKLISLIRSEETNKAIKLIDQLSIDELKIKDEHGLSAMHWIASCGNLSLLNKVPDLTNVISSNEGHTVLHAVAFAKVRTRNKDVAAILIRSNSNPNSINMTNNKQINKIGNKLFCL